MRGWRSGVFLAAAAVAAAAKEEEEEDKPGWFGPTRSPRCRHRQPEACLHRLPGKAVRCWPAMLRSSTPRSKLRPSAACTRSAGHPPTPQTPRGFEPRTKHRNSADTMSVLKPSLPPAVRLQRRGTASTLVEWPRCGKSRPKSARRRRRARTSASASSCYRDT